MKSNYISMQNKEEPYIKYPLKDAEKEVIMAIKDLLQRHFPRFICDISIFYDTDLRIEKKAKKEAE